MGMIARLREVETRGYAQQIFPTGFAAVPTASGVRVSQDNAITSAAVFQAITAITGTVGSLPLKVYQRTDDGRREAPEHPLYRVLHDQPTENLSAVEWRSVKQGHLLTRGNAYSEIVRNRTGQVEELIILNPDHVDIAVSARTGRRQYTVHVPMNERRERVVLSGKDVFHVAGLGFDGICGWPVITLARQSIGLGLAMEEYAAAFFGNGSQPRGILSVPETLQDETAARMKKSWEQAHQGLSNAHRIAVLEAGTTWQAIGLTAEDSQFLQSREFSVREVARWFNIPPHKLRDMEDATFSNIEQQSIEYFTDTIQPWVTRWEQNASLQLLTPEDRARGFYVEFNVDGMLRGDSEKRSQFYDTMTQIGAMTINEVRAKENMDPVPGGDTPFVRLDTIPLALAEQFAQAKIDGGEAGIRMLPIAPKKLPRAERRATDRLGVADEFGDLLRSAGRRMVRREVSRIRRLMNDLLSDDLDAFLDAVDVFYRFEWPQEVVDIMGPALRAYIAATARASASDIDTDQPDIEEFREAYVQNFSDRYSASSRLDVQRTASEGGIDALTQKLTEWDEGYESVLSRGDQTARREAAQALNATAKTVFAAAGVVAYRWVTRGDSCPLCNEIAGRVVRGQDPFVPSGTKVVGEDGRTITTSNTVGHPPLHDGCDCYVAPVIGGS